MPLSSLSAVVILAVTLGAAPRAHAQALGYGIAGPAGYSGFFGSGGGGHAAGGGEFLVGGRIGAGGEFGILGNAGSILFVTSANGVVHLVPSTRSQRVSPFVTGGYTRMSSGEGAFDAWNVGAGADIWVKPRLGFRVEFRDHVRPDNRGTIHYWAMRAGVVFR